MSRIYSIEHMARDGTWHELHNSRYSLSADRDRAIRKLISNRHKRLIDKANGYASRYRPITIKE